MIKLRNLLLMIACLLISGLLYSQVPNSFSFQAVVRAGNNMPVRQKQISFRASILQGRENGNVVYRENHTTTTDENGMISIEIGAGQSDQNFSDIDWANGPYYILTEIDPEGGNIYSIVALTQMLAVPYALYAVTTGDNREYDYSEILNAPTSLSEFTNDTGFISEETDPTVPEWAKTEDKPVYDYSEIQNTPDLSGYLTTETDPTVPEWAKAENKPVYDYSEIQNAPEQQTLSMGHDTLYLSGGSYVEMPASFSGDYNDLTNKPTIPANISDLNNDVPFITEETDPTVPEWAKAETKPEYQYSEIVDAPGDQTIRISNDTIYLSGVSGETSVKLPTVTTGGFDGDYNNLINKPDIPSSTSDLTNDSGFITVEDVPAQVNADWNATEGVAEILNKPTIPTVPTNLSAFTNDAGYITATDIPAQVNADWNATEGVAEILNKPTIPTVPTNLSAFTNDAGYITATDVPAQVNADWNATEGAAVIQNKPTIPTTTSQLTNDSGFITVEDIPSQVNADWNATEGAAVIQNKPTIPTVPTVVSAFTNDAGYITATDIPAQVNADWDATEGAAVIQNKPTIPTIPTVVSAFTNDAGYLTEATQTHNLADVAALGNEANTQLKNVTNPTEEQDAATKSYVDALMIALRADMLDTLAVVNAQHDAYLASLNSDIDSLGVTIDSLGVTIDSLGVVIDSLTNVIDSLNNIIENNDQLHESVDLGLPSGTKWATTNVGATSPEEFGDYFAWGETTTKTSYTEDNWNFSETVTVLPASNDAATANWDSEWRMPTGAEMSELINSCTWQWTTFYGVNGYKVTGTNGKSIFLPAAGNRINTTLSDNGFVGQYWSSSPNSASAGYEWSLYFTSGNYSASDSFGYYGCSVRPVKAGNDAAALDLPSITTNPVSEITSNSARCGGAIVSEGSSAVTARGICWNTRGNPTITDTHIGEGTGAGYFSVEMTDLDANTTYYVRAYATNTSGTVYGNAVTFTTASGHEFVDLGLPSGTLWATTNLGADTPEEVGDFYAWGETSPGSDFTQENYTYLDNPVVLPETADAATVSWGDQWRMPTEDETQELLRNCTWTWTTQNGASGYLVSNNGNSIFLPATGVMISTAVQETEYLVYWTSSIDVDDTNNATILMGYEQDKDNMTFNRFYGAIIRPVSGERSSSVMAPRVATGTVRNVTLASAVCEGEVTYNGGAEVTEQGICWSTSPNPTISDSYQAGDLSERIFSADLTGLAANTTYYVRAYATNSEGTAYGNETNFRTPSGTDDNHNYVDLGLPSGLKWATCNLGARNPEDSGYYFAWGEITTKTDYSQETYAFDGSPETLPLSNDAANSMWNVNWRIPTKADFQELLDNCTFERHEENGINGYRFIADNGNYIFLPDARLYIGTELYNMDACGDYWTSTLGDDPLYAWRLHFNYGWDDPTLSYGYRYYGTTIRAVYDEDGGESGDTGDSDTHEPVDLGLPSGTKWASTNVGAASPEDYGDFYAWGETSTKDSYTESSYGYEDRPSTLPSSADAATAKWGDDWRMPTADELQELYTIGEWSGESQNGVAGFRVTGPNGNSIFIPNAGYMGFEQFGTPYECYLWSSTYESRQATYLRYTGEGSAVEGTSSLYYGYSVRPVYDASGTTTSENAPEVTTKSVSDITNATATFSCEVTSDGGGTLTACGVCWSTSQNPTIDNDTTSEQTGFGVGDFTSAISGLSANTTYYIRAYATNGAGTSYGEEFTITTPTDAVDGQQYVDLGLTSGKKWAYYNVGAGIPEDYGDFYAWGETTTKDEYSWSNYAYGTAEDDINKYNAEDNKTTLDPEDDAAAALWLNGWHMPTDAEMQELLTCTWTWTSQNGVNGYKVVGPNGNFIFLPASGNYNGTEHVVGVMGSYWVNSILSIYAPYSAMYLMFTSSTKTEASLSRYAGLTIRAVNGEVSGDTGDTDTHEYVDLGLPSGTKWATTNVGASGLYEYGSYYAWGETSTKSSYTSDNYTYRDNPDVLPASADVATVKWGSDWRMPTKDELQELMNQCNWSWDWSNGINGYVVEGPNGNSIFLPAAGYFSTEEPNYGDDCEYWSSTSGGDNYAYYLYYYDEGHFMSNVNERQMGRSIRPVYVGSGDSGDSDLPVIKINTINNITNSSIDCTPEVTSEGGETLALLEAGICWSTSPNPTTEDNVINNASSMVMSTITGLSANTTYYIRAYATNAAGTAYSDEFTVTTPTDAVDGQQYVDLGLPSGLKWAYFNLGADIPEGIGGYFAWGEAEAKEEFSDINYNYTDNPTTLPLASDAANYNWNGDWRMPTKEDMQELIDNCTWTWIEQNGMHGYKVVGTNDNFIFLPASGVHYFYDASNVGSYAEYWTSTLSEETQERAWELSFDRSSHSASNSGTRYEGLAIRAVNGAATSGDTGDNDTHEPVDLGLPSGLKWASTNVGATSPEDYGDFYAWGETATKDNFSEDDYVNLYPDHDHVTQITLPASNDAATAQWGNNWRMPTDAEIQELITNCTWSWTTQNGVAGYIVSGPTGNSIFLPAAGHRFETTTEDADSYGYYWTSSIGTGDASGAWNLRISEFDHDLYGEEPFVGYTIRPVYTGSGDTGNVDLPSVETKSDSKLINSES